MNTTKCRSIGQTSIMVCVRPCAIVTSTRIAFGASTHSISPMPPPAVEVGSPVSSIGKFGITSTCGSLVLMARAVRNSRRDGASINFKVSSLDEVRLARWSNSTFIASQLYTCVHSVSLIAASFFETTILSMLSNSVSTEAI